MKRLKAVMDVAAQCSCLSAIGSFEIESANALKCNAAVLFEGMFVRGVFEGVFEEVFGGMFVVGKDVV